MRDADHKGDRLSGKNHITMDFPHEILELPVAKHSPQQTQHHCQIGVTVLVALLSRTSESLWREACPTPGCARARVGEFQSNYG